MAVLKNRGVSTGKSNFRQQAVTTNSTFGALADIMDSAYQFLEPIAIQKMQDRAHEDWGGAAKAAMGDPAGAEVMSSMSTAGQAGPTVPQVTTQPLPTEGQQIAADTMAALGKGGGTHALIREFEGFRETPYWDVNALRTGYGSDTVTLADGTVQKVTEGTRVTRADADRDLQRRVSTEFEPIAMKAVGAERFAAMTPGQKAALTSIAYNYGEIPDRIVGALQSGDTAAAAAAIRGLGGDNGGINRDRRNREADIFAGGAMPSDGGLAATLDAASGVSVSTAGPAAAPPQPVAPPEMVMISTMDGKREPRLFSPASGPILQAYNAVAQMEYNASVRLGAAKAFMDLSNQFELNPTGFQQAALAYVDEQVKAAPSQFRGELRMELTEQANSRFLGIMEEQQNDLKQRAANSNQALISQRSDALTAAMVSGDPNAIAAAQAGLTDVLRARESLPGLAWTPEQSSEVIRKSQEAAAAERERQQKVQTSAWKTDLDTIIKSAGAGLTAAQESILDNPMVQALLPDKAREALAAVTFRDSLPSFYQMPPSDMDGAIAEMEAQPVQEEWQVDMVKTARKVRDDAQKELDADPIKYAQDRLVKKPPAIIPPTEGPQAFIDSLAERSVYAREMQAAGFTETPVMLSKAEAEQMGTLFGKEIPAAIKAETAKAIVQGLGPDAAGFFSQIGQKDPVIRYSGMMMAAGGSTEIATLAIQGQELLDNKVVQAPSSAGKIEAFAPQVADALKFVQGAQQGELLQFATAIYAATAQGVTDEAQQKELMSQAVQKALGQSTDPKGNLIGGVQKIGEFDTLLPPDVAGDKVNAALEAAWSGAKFMPKVPMQVAAGGVNVWGALGQAPHMGGKPVDPAYADYMRLVPIGNDGRYRMEFTLPGGGTEPVMNQDGGFMVFALDDLVTAATPKAPTPAPKEPMKVDRQSYTLGEMLFGSDKPPMIEEIPQ